MSRHQSFHKTTSACQAGSSLILSRRPGPIPVARALHHVWPSQISWLRRAQPHLPIFEAVKRAPAVPRDRASQTQFSPKEQNQSR